MKQLKQLLNKVSHLVLLGLAVGLVWLQIPNNSALAATSSTDYLHKPIGETKSVVMKNERSQIVLGCLPQNLGEAQQQLQTKITDNLEDLGLSQLDRIFDLRANPELAQAKREFVQCLEAKGILHRG